MTWLQIRKRDADVERELKTDLELEEEEQREHGVPPEEARHAAMRSFGNPTLIREQTRAVWSWNGLESLLRDLRISVRTLFRSPGFSIIAVLVMALCIGATTSLFTVVRSVLLSPLPFRDPDRLVMIFEHFRDPSMNAQQFNYNLVAPADYYDWRTQTHGFEDLAAWRFWQFALTGERGDLPELVSARGGTWNLFPLLGVNAVIERTFTETEDRPDVSLDDAMGKVDGVQSGFALQNRNAPVAEDVAPRTVADDLARNVKKPLTVLLCAVGCMLLIGCLNVAHLLVARSAARQREIAIRSALGARKMTLIREQLVESLLVSLAGGITGALLSLAATEWLVSTWTNLPSARSIHADGTVLVFACVLVFATALLAGLLPAISSTGRGTIAALQASSRSAGSQSRTALRKTLLTVEIATTVVLLIAAGLLLKSFWRLRTTDVGCATDNVLTMDYSLPAKKYDSPEKMNAFNEMLLEQVRVMPGVRAAALASIVPGAGAEEDDIFTIPEHPPIDPGTALPDALYRTADPGYFSALHIPLLKGRFFTSQDRAGRPKTAVLNRPTAHQ